MEQKDTNQNPYYLRRKTKRNNISMKDNTKKSKITINLISLDDDKVYFRKYAYIQFSFSDKISLDTLMKEKTQTIEFVKSSKEIYFIDNIELGNEKETKKVNFLVSIYANKVNIFYISLKQNQNAFCFEYIFYAKNVIKLPKFLLSPFGEKTKRV